MSLVPLRDSTSEASTPVRCEKNAEPTDDSKCSDSEDDERQQTKENRFSLRSICEKDESFNSLRDLHHHEKTRSNVKYEERVLKFKQNLIDRYKETQPDRSSGSYICEECNMVFLTSTGLYLHTKNHSYLRVPVKNARVFKMKKLFYKRFKDSV